MATADEVEAEIRAQIAAQLEVKEGLDAFAEQVKQYWRRVSPVASGKYAASVKVFDGYISVDGMPGRRVGATDFKAHWIEFGTSADSKGGTRYVPRLGRKVDENTRTPEFAPRAKTAAAFGGDEQPGREDSQ